MGRSEGDARDQSDTRDDVAHGDSVDTRPVSICVLPPAPVVSMRRMVQEPAGDWTLDDVAQATGLAPDGLMFSVDGQVVERPLWSSVVPLPGQSVIVSVRPAGIEAAIISYTAASLTAIGVGTTIAATIGIVVATIAAGAALYGVSMLASSLLAPSAPDAPSSDPGVRRTISGSSNAFSPYATVPQVLGKHRVYPPLAARSYTAVEDGRLYQYALFTFGHGPLTLEDIKIGERPLFTAGTTIVYTGQMSANVAAISGPNGGAIKLELRQGGTSDAAITLFAADVQEQVIAAPLIKLKGAIARTTIDRATNITVIVGCPSGLVWINDAGNLRETPVRIGVRYRLVVPPGQLSTWTNLTDIVLRGKSRDSVYASRTWSVTEGTYEVECKRETDDATNLGVIDESQWLTMLVSRSGTPVKQTGLCLVAARIKISGEFSGLVDQFNAVATTVCPDWNPGTSAWVTRATRNPASIYRHVLQGNANKRAVADSKINLTALAAWHVQNTTNGFEFNSVTQGRSTVLNMLRQVASAGRAAPAIQDGLFTVVTENTLAGSPVQHFSPRNVRSMHEQRTYMTLPHALKVQFVDPDSGYLDTERIVPDDGYTTTTATTFERLDLAGITLSSQAYKLGRYHLAVLRLRPSEYVIETDFEHLDCVRGDLVRLNHDVILVGLTAGRVVSVTMSGADCAGVVLDQECAMAAGRGVRFRKSDGSTIVKPLATASGNQTTLTFSTVIASGDPMPVAGDLALFGVSGSESQTCIVKEIAPTTDLDAIVTLVDAVAGILTADTASIPKYDPQITLPPGMQAATKPLEKPRVVTVTSADARGEEGRGPVTSRGIKWSVQPSGVSSA